VRLDICWNITAVHRLAPEVAGQQGAKTCAATYK